MNCRNYRRNNIQPTKKTTSPNQQLIYFLIVFFGVLLAILGPIYKKYGISLFIGRQKWDYSPQEWRNLMETGSFDGETNINSVPKTLLLIGGPHRAGTTIVWETLTKHEELSGFGDSKHTGADFSEGIFIQSVYPTFSIGMENIGYNINMGLGQYALEAPHWTENHMYASDPSKMADILNSFGPYFLNFEKAKVIVEKSPPNAILSRFLDSLYNVPVLFSNKNDDTSTLVEPTRPLTKFLFVTRHPIANILAHDALLKNAVTLEVLMENYIKIHEIFFEDRKYLKTNSLLIKMEDFTNDPFTVLKDVYNYLEVDASSETIRAVLDRGRSIRKDPNHKYKDIWCQDDEESNEQRKMFVQQFGKKVKALDLKYDIESFCD